MSNTVKRPKRWCICGDPDCVDANYPNADAVDAYITEQAKTIEQLRVALAEVHPMNPDEPCNIYDIWVKTALKITE